ncbi:MAG: hypothetical protein K2H17_06210 [Duncaniella sp.]|nr:hypothetical protein [Duncaniella sp.]
MSRRITLAFAVCSTLRGGLRPGASAEGKPIDTRSFPQAWSPLLVKLTARRPCGHAIMPRLLTPSFHSYDLPCYFTRFFTASPSHLAPMRAKKYAKARASLTHWPYYRAPSISAEVFQPQ